MRVKILSPKRRDLPQRCGAQITLPGPPAVAVALRHSARARRLTLRISRLTGAVVLTLPPRTSRAAAEAFVAEREAWLRSNLAEAVPRQRPAFGQTIRFEGALLLLCIGPGRSVRREGAELMLPAGDDKLAARLAAWLKDQARARLVAAAERHAAAIGRTPGKITLRDPRGRWGSCNSRGDLMFSWRLVLAPPEVLDYVAAHEVAHLAEMNHGPGFWALTERLCPGHMAPRRWLKAEGASLHALKLKE